MKITPVKTPLVAKKMFPNYVWDVHTSQKELFLTFDDGPTPEITSWTLDILNQFNAKATFFCIGSNIEQHPNIFKTIISQGHAIGNHTQHHLKGWKTKTNNYIEDTLIAEEQINQFKDKSGLFRPPYGQIKPKQGQKLIALGYKIIMWDVLSYDWQADLDETTCLNNVIHKSKPGSIIVFHDSVKASKNMKYALPKVLDYFSKLDYTFKALEY